MRNVKFLTPAGDVLSYEADDGRTVVCDQGSPEFAAARGIGAPAPYVPPPPALGEYTAAIDRRVEATARGRGYNGAAHLASYAASTVPAWAAEAAAFVAWRDAVWVWSLAEMSKVRAGEVAAPSIDDLVAALPVIQWPE